MFERLRKILRNEGRFTAAEYGILAALMIIVAEQMAMKI
jgi:Flp pilus assembly pilin Flp